MRRRHVIALRREPQPCEMAAALIHVEPDIDTSFRFVESIERVHCRLVMVEYHCPAGIYHKFRHHLAGIAEIQHVEDTSGHIGWRLPVLHWNGLNLAKRLAGDPRRTKTIPASSVVQH